MSQKLFRPHRGGLADSLALTIEVSSIQDIYKSQKWIRKSKLSCKHQGFDDRTGWDTYMIIIDSGPIDLRGPIGFTNFDLKELEGYTLKLKNDTLIVGTIDWEDQSNIDLVNNLAKTATSPKSLALKLGIKETTLRTNIYRHFPGLINKLKVNKEQRT